MFINKYRKHSKNNKSSRKYFTILSVKTNTRHSANLFNLLWSMVITGGRLPLKQSEEERVINRITVNNPQLFTSRIEGDFIGIIFSDPLGELHEFQNVCLKSSIICQVEAQARHFFECRFFADKGTRTGCGDSAIVLGAQLLCNLVKQMMDSLASKLPIIHHLLSRPAVVAPPLPLLSLC